MPKATPTARRLAPAQLIERRIYLIRGQRIMLDSDLAELYQVPTKALNQAVRRNAPRFPPDFMFQLAEEEATALRSQFVTLETGRGRHSKYAPLVFTELGVAMLSSVLNSERAVQMNILIMRAFVKLRELLATNKDLARKLEHIEASQKQHARAIQQQAAILISVVQGVRKLKAPPTTHAIGFVTRSPKKR